MEDSRFARVSLDPRFKKISRKVRKLKIDGRFQKMFTDKSFTTKYFVDKRGSKLEKTSTEDLHKFYELSQESDEEKLKDEQQQKKKTVNDVKGNKNKQTTEEDLKTDKKVNKKHQEVRYIDTHNNDEDAEQRRTTNEQPHSKHEVDSGREEASMDSSSDEERDEHFMLQNRREEASMDSSSDEEREEHFMLQKRREEASMDSSTDDERDEHFMLQKRREEASMDSSSDEERDEHFMLQKQQEDIEHPWGEIDTAAKTMEEATRRLAVCNIDWDRVTATDLYVLFNSVKPRDGDISSIKIYPSEYGLEQIKKEAFSGPVELQEEGNNELEGVVSKEGTDFSMEKLRQYQLNRLKYYYAVIECNSPETAELLYEECDGTEFELSGNMLDLRFIPDDMEFEQEPHSVATALPAAGSYIAPQFSTTALHQTNVKLTWDETDPQRQRATMRKFKKEDILQMDFDAYLASSSDEDEMMQGGEEDEKDPGSSSEDEEHKIDKYKKLLKEIDVKEKKSDRDQELEITWEPGLQDTREEMVTRKITEKEKMTMTPWETYLKNKKAKRKEKRMGKDTSRQQFSGAVSDDSDGLSENMDVADPLFRDEADTSLMKGVNSKSKKKAKRADLETIEDKKAKDELELLLMDDKDDRQHFSLKGILENEKTRKKKRKRKLKNSEATEDNFNVNLEDSRFDALFTSHHFAVDPSDPQYRKTNAMKAILEERQRRRHETEGENKHRRDERESQSQTRDPSLSLLVKSVKSKTGQFHEQRKKKKTKTSVAS